MWSGKRGLGAKLQDQTDVIIEGHRQPPVSSVASRKRCPDAGLSKPQILVTDAACFREDVGF